MKTLPTRRTLLTTVGLGSFYFAAGGNGRVLAAVGVTESDGVGAERDLTASATSTSYPLPSDANVLNVRLFGAVGDGVTDDTQAILRAIASVPAFTREHPWLTQIVYFPSGTYKVTDTICRKDDKGLYQPHLVLIGEFRGTTTIRLADSSVGFSDPDAPKPVLFFSSGLKFARTATDGGRDYINKGEGNEAFGNIVDNLSIVIGRSNVGAVGIDYLANNIGAIRNVRIVAEERAAIGLAMTRRWFGPAIIKNTQITNFNVGIDIAQPAYAVVLDNVEVVRSKTFGLRNEGNVVSFSQLSINASAGCAIANMDPVGLIVGIGAVIIGNPSEVIANTGTVNLQGVLVGATLDDLKPLEGEGIYNGETKIGVAPWSLAVVPPPDPEYVAPLEWQSVTKFGAVPDANVDSTEAFVKAFASGARFLYIPTGRYAVTRSIDIGADVEQIDGLFSIISADRSANPASEPFVLFHTGTARQKPLHIRRVTVENFSSRISTIMRHEAECVLTLADIAGGAGLLDRAEGGGAVFGENIAGQIVKIQGGQPVRFRQFNSEGEGVRIHNGGAPLWILGLKTEGNNTLLENVDGAVSELVGGLICPVTAPTQTTPLIVNRDSYVALSCAEYAVIPTAVYDVLLDSIVASKQTIVRAADTPRRGAYACVVPLLVAGSK